MIRRWYRQLGLLWWSLGTYSVISATKLLHQMEGGREERGKKGERGIEQLLFARGSRGSSGPVVVWSGGSDLHVLGLPSLLEEEVQARLSILQCPVPSILPLRHGRERGRREEGGKKGGEERRGGK